jgi:thiol-disulfide isomerase/thioredoxin
LKEVKKKKLIKSIVVVIWLSVCLLLAVIAVFFVINSGLKPPLTDNLMQVEVEREAPDFSLDDIQGVSVNLSSLRGQVVILNFWATWCGPCVEEMPMLTRFQNQHPEIIFIGINEKEDREKVERFLDQNAFRYLILLDTHAEVAELYKIMTLPTTIIIDEDGFQRFQHIGVITESQLDFYLEELNITK